jgi:RES domain-containing protein
LHYRGLLYRALNPIRAREPLSGEGARLHGGRFSPKGTAALYTAMSVMTAIREANQIGTLQPTTLVCYEADITPIFDATDPVALSAYDMLPAALTAEDWRLQMQVHGKAPTQNLADRLIDDGYAGMRVRSFAKGATTMDFNMVLWVWGSTLPTKLALVDNEGRLL